MQQQPEPGRLAWVGKKLLPDAGKGKLVSSGENASRHAEE